MQNKVLYIITIVSVATALYSFLTPPTLEESAQTLSKFGEKLGRATETTPISREDEEKIRLLARKPIVIPKFAKENVIVSAGVNFLSDKNKEELEPVIVNSLTGKKIKSCGKIELEETAFETNSKKRRAKDCVQVAEVDERVKTALSINSPVNGKINVKGETKDAKFVVITQVFFEGSECTTTYINGDAYVDCQSARPNRRR